MSKGKAINKLQKKERASQRGTFLTSMLFFLLLFQMTTTQAILHELIYPDRVYLFSHTDTFIYMFSEFILTIIPFLWVIIFMGIWQWKKKAVYASIFFIGANLVLSSFLIYSRFFPEAYHPVFSLVDYLVVPNILSACCYLWAVRQKWYLFTQ